MTYLETKKIISINKNKKLQTNSNIKRLEKRIYI